MFKNKNKKLVSALLITMMVGVSGAMAFQEPTSSPTDSGGFKGFLQHLLSSGNPFDTSEDALSSPDAGSIGISTGSGAVNTSQVVPNKDGGILERLEFIQDNILTTADLLWGSIIGIPEYITDGDDVLTETEVDAFADNNGYLKTVSGANIIDGTITASDLGANSVGTSEVTDNTITATDLKVTGNGTTAQYLRSDADGSFSWATPVNTDTHLTEAQVDSYADNNGYLKTVASANIIDGTITASDLGANSVGTSEVTDNTITATDLKVTGNGTTAQYLRSDADGSFSWATPVNTDTHLTEAQVDSYADNNGYLKTVASANIIDGTITADDLGANSVGDSELIDSPTFVNPTASAPTASNHVATRDWVLAQVEGNSSSVTMISARATSTMTHANAAKYCWNLTASAEKSMDSDTTTTYSDWHLPSVEEGAIFEGTITDSNYIWTSTVRSGSSDIWIRLRLSDGDRYGDNYSNSRSFRCVR